MADAVVASGFRNDDGRAPCAIAETEPIQITVGNLNSQAGHIRLASPQQVDEAAAGTSMATTRIDIEDATHGTIAAVRSLRWPRLREVRIHAPSPPAPVRATNRADATARTCAALGWALALPRLAHLAIMSSEHLDSDALDALLRGVDGRTARGLPPLRLALACGGSAACAARLVAHPAVAMVSLRIFLTSGSQATKKEALRLCAALACPAGPAALREFSVQAAQIRTFLPDAAVLRPLVRAQPLLRVLEIGW